MSAGTSKRVKKWLIRALPWVITLLLIRFIISRGGDLNDLHAELQQARWGWLLLAILFQAGAFGAVAWLNELLLRAYGVAVPWFRQYFIQFTMAFVETVIPSAAVSGLLLRVHLLKPYGAAPDVAILTSLVETVAIAVSVAVPALLVALIVLVDGHVAGQLLWWLTLGLTIILSSSFITARQWRKGRLRLAGAWLIGRLTIIWDEYVAARWPRQLVDWPSSRVLNRLHFLLGELMPLLRKRLHLVVSALTLRTACEAAAFIACFYTFGETLPLLTLLILYTVTITINTLGGIPGGVGLAEVSLASIYLHFGITPESAVAVALAYRVTGYWLPRAVGGLAWLWLEYLHRFQPITEETG
jgi:uncharacterized protein (TIRG00374 family)